LLFTDDGVYNLTVGAIAMLKEKEKTSLESVDSLIIGESGAIRHLREIVRRVAKASVSVMIAGPSGSGKEMVARAIHAESTRSNKPFVALNCGAIPVELIESELFGHERGAFTGANARRQGRFEEAHNGTLFLDEIGDMRFDMQVKLLRVLEDSMVTRVGGNGALPVDVRVISATHQNIEKAIAENRFREDLFFRLGVVPVRVPPLAERIDDIPLLIAHFQSRFSGALKAKFDRQAMLRLQSHDWPGNVRELRNIIERANVLFGGSVVGEVEVNELLGKAVALVRPAELTVPAEERPALPTPDPLLSAHANRIPIDLKALLETMELERIQMALDMANGVVSEAARMLTLKRTTLIEKMRKYRLDRAA
jgi:sigma-54 dependent transcriptional regulator, flagellar regulatory protein